MEISYFKRDYEKGNFFFLFFVFFLHPVPPYGEIMKTKKGLELVTCLFELQNMFTKIHFLVRHFESGNWKEKEKKQNTEYLKNKKCFLEKIKTIFHNF